MTTQTKPTRRYWVYVIIFLLWNIIGLLSFLGHTFMPQSMKDAMKPEEIALMESFPSWMTLVFAIAVLGGLLGCIGLLLRKKWAKILFVISLIAILIQMTYNLFFTDSIAVYGLAQAITMPILVIIFGLILPPFAQRAIDKGWLN